MHAFQRLVAIGMTGYAHAAFRVRVFGLERLRIEPGTVVAVSHRSEQDVPLLIGSVYRGFYESAGKAGAWPAFAAREDLFLPGFLAGAPPKLPLALRRALWPLTIAGALERHLLCKPVREPMRMRLVELLRASPDRSLEGWLPPELSSRLYARASRLGRPRPLRASEVLDGGYADILWQVIERDTAPQSDQEWRVHLRTAVADFRALVDLLRRGEVLVMFPEGEPSVTGEIGLLQGGLASLVRRGRPRSLQPIAIAYDPLLPGRTRAYVSVAMSMVPVSDGVEQAVCEALRRATPLTAGQIAAFSVVEGVDVADVQRDFVDRALSDGRPVAPEVSTANLARACARARRLGASHSVVRRLACELKSAHELYPEAAEVRA